MKELIVDSQIRTHIAKPDKSPPLWIPKNSEHIKGRGFTPETERSLLHGGQAIQAARLTANLAEAQLNVVM